MKTLSGTVKFVVFAIIAMVAVITFRAFAQPTAAPTSGPKKFTLKIGRTNTEFVDVKSKKQFIDVLGQLKEDQYKIDFKDHDGAPVEHYPPLPGVGIKTDKVTTSEVAQNASSGEPAANDPNVVYRVMSDSTTEIKSVLDTFK
jgi:hypothetical protein